MPGIGSELEARLRVICGAANVVTDAHELAVYRPRLGVRTGAPPLVVVLPANATETAACVAACAAARVAWVPRGAGTWTSGDASPGAVTIAVTRMRRVLAADPAAGVVRAEAGTPGRLLHRALHANGEIPPTESVATLGGLLASPHREPRTLSGHRLRVLALTLVLPNGSLAELNAGAPGYDLLGAFVGSAGTVGIAVDATVALAAPLDLQTTNAPVALGAPS